MNTLFKNSELKDLIVKVETEQPLEREDGLRLFESKDLLAIGYMADLVRRRKNGDYISFINDEYSQGEQLVDGQELGANSLDAKVATMVYGHGESYGERIEQLLTLRETQLSQGWLTFLPILADSPGTGVKGSGNCQATGYDVLKMLAVSRLFLDNFQHISAVGTQLGPKLAQVSLAFGVDDLQGTNLTLPQILQMVRAAGRIPVERNRSYEIVREDF